MAGDMPIRYAVEDGIATVTIDRPERRNALSWQALEGLTDAWQRAEEDAAVQEDLASGRLTAARISRPLLRRPVYLVRHPRRVVTRASQQVEELIVSILKGMVADGSWLAQWVGP